MKHTETYLSRCRICDSLSHHTSDDDLCGECLAVIYDCLSDFEPEPLAESFPEPPTLTVQAIMDRLASRVAETTDAAVAPTSAVLEGTGVAPQEREVKHEALRPL